MSAERVEGELTVPASTSVSATTVAQSATTVTATAGTTFPTSLLSDLQSLLNNNSQGYPQSTTAAAAAIGGTWTGGAGWLFNITSGNDTGAFGGVTMTAVNTPTYGTAGPRSGVDLAIGFDGSTDAFSAGNNFSVGATDDLILAWVGKTTSVATDMDWVAKYTAGVGWFLYKAATNVFLLAVNDGTGSVTALSTSVAINEWHVGIAVIDRGANQIRCGIRTLSGTTYLGSATSIAGKGSFSNAANMLVGNGVITGNGADTSANIAGLYVVKGVGAAAGLSAGLSAALTTFANAINASWSVSMSATTGLVSIGWTGYATPTWSLSWTSTTLRNFLGFAADITNVTTTQTGTSAMKGVWIPGCPIAADSDVKQAPTGDDRAATISPTGHVYSLASSEFYRHRNVRFSHVAQSFVWSGSATYPNQDWETFYLDTQLAHHSWFSVGSRVKVYWDNAGVATQVGSGTVSAWSMPKCVTLDELRLAVNGWTGLVEINLGDLYGAT